MTPAGAPPTERSSAPQSEPQTGPRSESQAGRGIVLVLIAATLWSSSGLFIKVLTLPAFELTGLRALLAAVTLAPFVRWRSIRLDRNLALLTVAFAATTVCFVQATRWTTAANAIALMSTSPGWVFLLGCIATRRIVLPLLAPLALIGAGIAAMLLEPTQGTSLHGNLLGLLAGFTFAQMQIAFKRVNQPALGAVMMANVGTLLTCLLVAPQAFDLAALTPWDWLALGFLGAFQIALSFVFFTAGVQRITVHQASVLTLLEPLLNPVWVYLAIGEVPSRYGFAGFALILAGIVVDFWVRLTVPALHPAHQGPPGAP